MKVKEEDLWLERAKEGDAEAFSKVYKKYKDVVLGRCKKIMKDPVEADDQASISWLMAWKNLHQCRGKFSSWMYMVVTNSCLQKIRFDKQEDKKRKKAISHIRPEMYLANTASVNVWRGKSYLLPNNDADSLIDAKKHQELIIRALPYIDDKSKKVLSLKLRGAKNKEIAESMGSTVLSVKAKVHRLKKTLKEVVKGKRIDRKTKKCIRCLRSLPEMEEYFSKHRNTYSSKCVECEKKEASCPGCGKILPLTSEYFYQDSRNRRGFRPRCKLCHNKRKICSGCKEEKLLSSRFFHRDKRTSSGFRSLCKVCVNARRGRKNK